MLTEDWIASLANYQTLFVGLSGGLDSTVLLHAIAKQPKLASKLQAVHVHHGLSVNASDWEEHCRHYCDTLSIPFISRKVECNTRSNIEEGARIARYQVFASLLNENDCMLLGHHADDLAETVLLQLFRGTGIDGMAAMPSRYKLSKGTLARPLLQHSQEMLEAYANRHQLMWIEDESNQNNDFSRNYLRQQIMPLLRKKWPGVVENLGRTATHCQQAKSNLEALAELDCVELIKGKDKLNLMPLVSLNQARLANVLRVWLRRNDVRSPSTSLLQRLIDEVIFGRRDATAMVEWDDIVVRRYQQTLYLLKMQISYQSKCTEWSGFPGPLQLDEKGYQYLYARSVGAHYRRSAGSQNEKISLIDPPGLCISSNPSIQVSFRQGGELFYWRGQHKQLKKLFQQWQIPPWQRDQIPLLYINGELAAVVGYAVSDHHYALDPANAYYIHLHSK